MFDGNLFQITSPGNGAFHDLDILGSPLRNYVHKVLSCAPERTESLALPSPTDTLILHASAWVSPAMCRALHAAVAAGRPAVLRSAAGDDVIGVYVPAGHGSGVFQGSTGNPAAVLETAIESMDLVDAVVVADSFIVRDFVALAAVENAILLERAEAAARAGVRLRDPSTVAIRGELVSGSGVIIDVDVQIRGTVYLGDGVEIGPHVILDDATVMNNTKIHAFSMIERSSVGAFSVIGPYARLRPGSVVGDRSQIGNFVELKNTSVGAGARINHHAFVGDAELGTNVTLGAGTITCNHNQVGIVRTVIGAGAYVGSGTELVAPVTVGENATIGAGSTITKDAPAGKLTVARAQQVTILNWSPPTADE